MMSPASDRSADLRALSLLLLSMVHKSSAHPLQSQPDSPSPSMLCQASRLLHQLPDRFCFLPGAHRPRDLLPARIQIHRSRLRSLLSSQILYLLSAPFHLPRFPSHLTLLQTRFSLSSALLPAYLNASLYRTLTPPQAECRAL